MIDTPKESCKRAIHDFYTVQTVYLIPNPNHHMKYFAFVNI